MTTTSSTATPPASGQSETPRIAEIVRFRLAARTTDAAFLEAAQATEPFVSAAIGFIARRLSKNEDGTWTSC